jgi:hypothetical protein
MTTSTRDRYPHCESTKLNIARCLSDGPHHSKLETLRCHRFMRHLPATWSLDRAARFVVPFGKHKVKPIGDLWQSQDGRLYLTWAADNWDNDCGEACRVALGLVAPEEESA